MIGSWYNAGIIMSFRPKLVGYLHGLAFLMRSQRRLEEDTAEVVASLSDVLLYASGETQTAAIEVFRTLGLPSRELSQLRQGSPEASEAHSRLGGQLGDTVVAWRASAVEDLGAAR